MKQNLLLGLATLPLLGAGVIAFAPSILPTNFQAWFSQKAPGGNPNPPYPGPAKPPLPPLPNPPSTPSPTPQPPVTSTTLPPVVATKSGYPAAAERFAHATGRKLIPLKDAQTKAPYNSIGRFFNEDAPTITVGSGVLIHADVVLSAAHVILAVDERSKTLGRSMFAVPGMKPVPVGHAELDGEWRRKVVTADIGVCKLDHLLYPPLQIHATNFDIEDEPLFDSNVTSYGYDLDLWEACGYPDPPPLVERSGRFMPFSGRFEDTRDKIGKFMGFYKNAYDTVSVLPGMTGGGTQSQQTISASQLMQTTTGRGGSSSLMGQSVRVNQTNTGTDVSGLVTGASLLVSTLSYMQAENHERFGWSSEMIGSLGCDGGPVLTDNRVVAVAGYPNGEVFGPTNMLVGHLKGTRLTSVVADMVENFR